MRSQPDEPPQEPIYEDRECRPVLVVGSEQITEVPRCTFGYGIPLVGREPYRTAERDEEWQREDFDGDERAEGDPPGSICARADSRPARAPGRSSRQTWLDATTLVHQSRLI